MKLNHLPGDWDRFAEVDPFNNNFVEGLICRSHGDFYGGLMIEKVNHEKAPQMIHCTPKLRYPFTTLGDGTVKWTFPKAQTIHRYEKLDGTNVFAYRRFRRGLSWNGVHCSFGVGRGSPTARGHGKPRECVAALREERRCAKERSCPRSCCWG